MKDTNHGDRKNIGAGPSNSETKGVPRVASTFGWKALVPWTVAIVLIWIFDLTLASEVNPYFFSIAMYAGINIILAVSLNLVNGFTGQFSMGHAGFMAVGGYCSAFITGSLVDRTPSLANDPLSSTLIFVGSLLAGGILAAIAGVIVGLPSLRLKGDYLAIVTLGFGEIIRVLLLNTEAVGGARGLTNIPAWTSVGWLYTFVILTVFYVWRIMCTTHGRAFLSVREDEVAAEAMGVNTTRTKVKAFVIGAFFAGVAGGLFAHYLRYLNPAIFDFNRSFEIIIMVVLGGMGSITGSVIAAALLTFIREALRELQDYTQVDLRMIIYALLLIVLMLTRPNGLFGTKELKDFFRKKEKGLSR
jgi:branched-chain amino acid transport system permease protein